MEIVNQVFNQCLNMVVQLWNTALNNWGIFGSFIIFYAVLKVIARTFNKLKGIR